MIFYILAFFIISFCYGVGRSEESHLRFFFLFIAFIGIWLISGLRGDVGQDTHNYARHFYELGESLTYPHYFSNIEPLFAIFMAACNWLFNDVTYFFMLFALLQAVILWFILKRVWHYNCFLLAYLFVFYLDLHMGVIRSGLAILLFLLALSYAPSKVSFFLFFMSLLTHISVFILAPFFINRMDLKAGYKVFFFIVIAFGFFLISLFLSGAVSKKVLVYFVNESFDFRIPKVMMLIGLFGASMIFIQRTVSKDFLIIFLALLVIWIASTGLIIFTRIHLLFLLLFFFVAFETPSASVGRLNFRPTFIYVLTLVIWFGFGNIAALPYEREKRLLTGIGHPDFTFSPYSLFWSSEHR